MRALATVAIVGVLAGSARAEPVEVDRTVDASVTLGAAAAAFLFSRIPVDTKDRWDEEAFGELDAGVHERFSAKAAALSDLLVATAIAAPIFTEAGGVIDDGITDRYLVYGEALAISLALNAGAKYLVQRPRPYTYHKDPRVAAYAAKQGKDSHLSFYSGHAALSFTAATTGGYLFATRSTSTGARAAMWATGMTVASATSILRVRAGKHFYSDIAVGAGMGVLVGYLVPALHHDGIELSAAEGWSIAGGVVAGTLVASLLPLPDDVAISLQPIAVEHGAGIAFGGKL
jgi:membrane-associated phospholipid phosphatase